jgi:hypothetical protein
MDSRYRIALSSFLLFLLVMVVGAQNPKHESPLKTVRGVVIDKGDNPVPGGVVFLKNMRSNQIRSNIADNQGQYRFSGLDPNSEYELHAEKDGAKSQTRNVSSFDSRMDIVLNLKLDKKKD